MEMDYKCVVLASIYMATLYYFNQWKWIKNMCYFLSINSV